MEATRQDAWTHDEDQLLADTVIHYIEVGKTQLDAFKEVAKRLSRTSAACGFRWNATIRKTYDEAIQRAKETRTQVTKGIQQANESHQIADSPIETAISMLERLRQNYSVDCVTQEEQKTVMEKLQQENDRLQRQLKLYQDAWAEMGKLWEWVTREHT